MAQIINSLYIGDKVTVQASKGLVTLLDSTVPNTDVWEIRRVVVERQATSAATIRLKVTIKPKAPFAGQGMQNYEYTIYDAPAPGSEPREPVYRIPTNFVLGPGDQVKLLAEAKTANVVLIASAIGMRWITVP